MISWCKNCLNASTRPRIEFDHRGWCNACQWMEEKKSLNWAKRESELHELLEKHRGKGDFDCIVTVSGGKDGSYVAHTLKSRYGINALCLTVRPPMPLELGDKNLISFINSGFEHIHVSVNQESMRILDRIGFLDFGQGYYGWLIAIHTAVLRIANSFGINLVFYSEDGEIEYGGSTERKNIATYGIEYMKKAYLNSTYDHVIKESGLSKQELYWFEFDPSLYKEMSGLDVTHFSYYEAWDPYRNYLVAKEFCGLEEYQDGVVGTFTNFAQNDQELASLHYYLMYLKFGFGRATQDAGIEIRRGAMTREQAINLVNIYDNQPPVQGFERYAKYYGISLREFLGVLDKFANKDLFEKVDGYWKPRFVVT
ncbi:MAG: legionaminic acid biosynthesis protein PtmG [Hydrogenophilales bacterium 28-61-23]|nr:MAG: legionaminic acid biosynthesis protein PtmG [Hydrogenophilales bacterium 28-61-23]